MVTNGWNFTATGPLIAKHQSSIEAISFSLDGADEGVHDTIRGRGSFRKVLSALSWCAEHRITTQINTVVHPQNRNQLHDLVQLAANLGCRALGLAHCQPTPENSSHGLLMDVDARLEVEADIAELQRLYQLPILLAGDHFDPHPIGLCPQLEMRTMHIDVRGRLSACCELSAYRGGEVDTDIVADLNETHLTEALRRLADRSRAIIKAKANRLGDGALTPLDHFICTRCMLDYNKVDENKFTESAS